MVRGCVAPHRHTSHSIIHPEHVDSRRSRAWATRCCARKRRRAPPVEKAESKSAVVEKKLIDDLIDTMTEYHGVGLASTVGRRKPSGLRRGARSSPETETRTATPKPLILINPVISRSSAAISWTTGRELSERARHSGPGARERIVRFRCTALDHKGRSHRIAHGHRAGPLA